MTVFANGEGFTFWDASCCPYGPITCMYCLDRLNDQRTNIAPQEHARHCQGTYTRRREKSSVVARSYALVWNGHYQLRVLWELTPRCTVDFS